MFMNAVLMMIALPFLILNSAQSQTLDEPLPLSDSPLSWSDAEVETILGDVSSTPLIAIGESLHDSAGISQVQHRLIKRLIERHKFRLVFWEANSFRTDGLTEWVRTGVGNLEKEMQTLHHASIGTREILLTLRAWNVKHPRDTVELVPVDVYVSPWITHARVVEIFNLLEDTVNLQKTDIAFQKCWGHSVTSKEEWSTLLQKISDGSELMDDERFKECRQALISSIENVIERREKLRARLGKKNYADLLVGLQSLWARQGHLKGIYSNRPPNWTLGWNSRDQMMAENLLTRWDEFRNQRGVFIAHTSHVSKNGEAANWWNFGEGAIQSAGHFLKSELGDLYRVIAVTGYKMEGSQGDYLAPTSEDSIDFQLHKNGFMAAAYSTRGTFAKMKEKWFIQNENDPSTPNGVLMNLKDHFDEVIFLDQSRASPDVPSRLDHAR
jgi:erythromycin esterase-like protein